MTTLEHYLEIRRYTEKLCKLLQAEDFTPQSASFSSPPKWHIAHTTWFFEEMILKEFLPNYKVFNDSYGYLFNSYYNSLGERLKRENRGLITRPDHQKIFEYRTYVDAHMSELLKQETPDQVSQLTILGINHEQQHQELILTDLKYTFSLNPMFPKFWDTNLIDDVQDESGWLSVEEGIYNIGHEGDGFCFDNELGRHRVFLEFFQISKSLVTNAEYIRFINAGGYENADYWLDEGLNWVQSENIKTPLYWKQSENSWYHYTLSGLHPINPNHSVTHISYYEAFAFSQWAGCRLPTEFEWEIASKQLAWGQRWEWTNSAYLPYPKFKIAEGAIGEYNGKFMSNQMVLRGASSATSKNHSRNTYRNFFQPHARWQFSGIRLAK